MEITVPQVPNRAKEIPGAPGYNGSGDNKWLWDPVNRGISLGGMSCAGITCTSLGSTEKWEMFQTLFERIQTIKGFCQMLDELFAQVGTQPNSTENTYVNIMKTKISTIQMILWDLYEITTPDT
jgi:hypothetical protein